MKNPEDKFILTMIILIMVIQVIVLATTCDAFAVTNWDYKNHSIFMSHSEAEYFAQVVEAESNRIPGDMESRVYVAAVILNRVRSPYFRNTVRGVLDEPGQFTTTSGGRCYISATDESREAIRIAEQRIYHGEIPSNLLFFNCIGYNNGTPYDYIGGNYFMTYGG